MKKKLQFVFLNINLMEKLFNNMILQKNLFVIERMEINVKLFMEKELENY